MGMVLKEDNRYIIILYDIISAIIYLNITATVPFRQQAIHRKLQDCCRVPHYMAIQFVDRPELFPNAFQTVPALSPLETNILF